MEKKDRAILFHQRMKSQPNSNSPQAAWNLMSTVLAQIENQHAPPDKEHMTILPLNHKDVQAYGQGGYYIPLFGYEILLNANGAIGIKNLYEGGTYSLTLAGANGIPFV